MKKTRLWDYIKNKWVNSKLFSPRVTTPRGVPEQFAPPPSATALADFELVHQKVCELEAKDERSFEEEEMLGRLKKERERLGNQPTGERHIKVTYGEDE